MDAARLALHENHQIGLVATAKASPESKVGVEEFRDLAEECGAYFIETARFRPTDTALLVESKCDIGLTMNWPTLINSEVTSSFPLGIINAHGSDLPKFRGNACPNWAILCNEPTIGVTFHLIDPFGLDTGDVVLKKWMNNRDDIYIGDIYDWLRDVVPKGLVEAMNQMATPGFKPIPQETGFASRAYPRRPSDGRIVFTYGAEHLHRLIRASSRPFSGAYCFYEGKQKLVVWRATRYPLPTQTFAVPGQIMHFEGANVVVACENGALRFEEYELEGGAILPRSVRARFE